MKLDQAFESLRNMFFRPKVLVTGGSGYLGSHVCKMLKRENWNITILDIKKPKHNYFNHFEQIDVCDYEKVNHLFWKKGKFDIVFHFAGKIEVGESVNKPNYYYHTNTGGTCTILLVMEKYGCENIIYSSTAGLYQSKDQPLLENDELNPMNNPYAGSKYASELAIKQSGMNHIIFRYFNLAGADEDGDIGENHEPETHLIPKILQNLNNFEIYGSDYETKDGTCVRDYVHVSDVARVHIDAANYLLSEKRSHVLNLGTGTGYSVLEVIDAIEKHTNQKVFKQYHQRRAGDPPKLVSNIDLAKKILNYDPKHDISSIVKTAYNWERNGRKDS